MTLDNQRQEKAKKILNDRERKEKKREDLRKKQQKIRIKKMQENDDMRKHRMHRKELDVQETSMAAEESYVIHLKEVAE